MKNYLVRLSKTGNVEIPWPTSRNALGLSLDKKHGVVHSLTYHRASHKCAQRGDSKKLKKGGAH